MKTEFFNDKTACFKPGILFKELGDIDFKPFEELSENKKNILYMLFMDNRDTKKLIDYERSHGITDRDEILKYIISKKLARLDGKWDIDETTLNFEA